MPDIKKKIPTKTFTNIGGEEFETKDFKLPDSGRLFRAHWKQPNDDGVIDIDWKTAIPAYKAEMIAKLEEDLATHRQDHTTAAKEGIYARKKIEAVAALADKKPAKGKYPLLEASVPAEANSIREAAELIMSKSNAADLCVAKTEKVFITAKKAVNAAKSYPQIDKVMAAVTW